MPNSVRLDSERFDDSSAMLARAMNAFNTDQFGESVLIFKQSIDKYQELLAMKTENEKRASEGMAQAYSCKDFYDV